ncbi:MAG: hypothetical protein EOO06_04235 [Chitinophagaceae bacterium]|nr:MAG: hypothetical protein EOO06_04235 [Chitinophagaceae bacterium]
MKLFKCLMLLYGLFAITSAAAQNDPEFPGGFVMHAKLHNGLITNFHSGVDLYTGGVQVIPQFGIIPQKLRAGVVAGAFYANKRLDGQFGPTLSVKLKTFNAGPFGSAANLHLSADHLWGTNKQKLVGGGVHVDLLNKLVLGLTAHRDYEYNNWWLQTALGLRISKVKKTREPFNE